MKKALMVLVILLMAVPGWTAEKFATDASFLQISEPKSLYVVCEKGFVEISFLTGEATFENCDPQEASKALWIGLKPYFEEWKKEICQEKKQFGVKIGEGE